MQEQESKEHISNHLWELLAEGAASDEEFQQILEHTRECAWCAEKMADVMERGNAAMDILPPVYLKDQILQAIARPEVKITVTGRRFSKNMRLLLYGLKVSAAVAISVFMLLFTTEQERDSEQLSFRRESEWEGWELRREHSLTEWMNDSSGRVTDYMNNMTNFIINGGKTK